VNPSDSTFHPTRWTLVLRSRGQGEDAKAALSDLCAAYYEPVVSFLRREGRNDDAARETAHAFFESVLTGGVGTPDPARGRFRSYLLGALKHFLSKSREAARTGKRCGGAEHLPLDSATDIEPGITDDTLAFDREWALTLIARALASVEQEHAHKPDLFVALKPWLDGSTTDSQADAARALGISETAVKVAIHRLRVRFRELIRAEVSATVHEPDEVGDEIRHLIAVASGY
jgi:RNA polymerase sigma-70 factor (ECF subfamily)